ncbi:MAG: germination protein YpeB [Ruminococcaceae bacterium]|nr:germination protein YpeB [Oscillospiraceae bacterium]
MKSEKYVKKRTLVLAASYLTAAVVALGVLAGVNADRAQKYRILSDNQYQHAFNELVTAVGEMDSALQKSCLATSPSMVNAMCTEIFGKAMTAQMALGVLPYAPEKLEQTSGFISRVGDYAFSLSRAAADGSAYSAEQLESLRALAGTAGVLSQNLRELQSQLQSGALRLPDSAQTRAALLESAEDAVPNMGDRFRLIEEEFPEVPSLIYDGPFSEHLSGMAPRALENLPEADTESARDTAAGFLGISRGKVYPLGECGGDLPCYGFAADTEGGGEVYIAVTKQGGRVLSMLTSRPVGSENVSKEDALKAAEDFLRRAGYDSMAQTYHMTQGGILTVNYAYRQDGVLCYSDLVKVSVALDTGKVCGFEAKGYLTAHTARTLPEIAVSAEQARSAVPADLSVLAVQTALVPSDGKYETLCHEFKCEADDGSHYIIYVNAVTGRQHKILILLEDESGTLTL